MRSSLALVVALTTLAVAPPALAASGGSSASDTSQTGGVDPNQATPAPTASPDTSLPESGKVMIAKANLRSKPGTGRILRRVAAGTPVKARCTTVGALGRTKRDGQSRLWVQVRVGKLTGYVHDVTVNPSGGLLLVPLCGVKPSTGRGLPGVTQGACAVKPPVKLIAPFDTPADFIAAVLPGARDSRAATDVPVSVTLAQAILETGAGKSSAAGNNFFGIKARATSSTGIYAWGKNAVGCTIVKTREAERTGLVLTVGAFRAYDTLRTSVLDHGDLLRSNPVYAPAFKYTKKPKQFMREIAKRYATDPAYATKLLSLMSRYDLLKYDK